MSPKRNEEDLNLVSLQYISNLKNHIKELENILSRANIDYPPLPQLPLSLSNLIQEEKEYEVHNVIKPFAITEENNINNTSPPLPPRDDEDANAQNSSPEPTPKERNIVELHKLLVYDTSVPLPDPIPTGVKITKEFITKFIGKSVPNFYKVMKEFRSKDSRILKLIPNQKIVICKQESGWGFGFNVNNKSIFGFCPMSYLMKSK